MEISIELFTLEEVAKALKVSKQTLYTKIKNGNIKATKFGREYRFTKEQLNDLINNGF